MRAIGAGSGRFTRALVFSSAVLGFALPHASADDRFTVCSITINSDDEIRTLEKYLPSAEFRFVELTDHARATPAAAEPSWFGRACASGVRCDMLMISAHFGNTWAGNYGTTFAGKSGISLSLEELEDRRYDESCPGILADPLEVFLFACQTMATRRGQALPAADLELFARHHLSPVAAERVVDEVRHQGEGTSNLDRMQFVFAGVPHLYGFTDVGPSGKRVAPLLEEYLRSVGDYGDHLRWLKVASAAGPTFLRNEALAQALEPTCFAEAHGFAPAGVEYRRGERACRLRDRRRAFAERLELVERLLDEPEFLSYLPRIQSFFREHQPYSPEIWAGPSLGRIRANARARTAVIDLLHRAATPILRLEALRLAHGLGWISEEQTIPIRRQIVGALLRPPMYGESRDLVCRLAREAPQPIDIRSEDVALETYGNEFGIQALACLRPSDPRIHERLGRSLFDSREWIARLSAIALKEIRPGDVGVQVLLAEQLGRAETGPRSWAGEALRALRPSDPRVLRIIQAHDPTFQLDGF